MKMKSKQSLRRRIAGAFILMAFILCSFFSLASYVAVEMAEAKLIDHNLDKLTNQIIGQYLSKQEYELPPDMNFYVDDDIPETFRKLPNGTHEIEIGETRFHVVVRTMNAHRFALSDDTTDFEDTELLIFSAVTAGFFASMLLSVLLGLTSSKLIIAPVTALAEAVERNDEPSKLPSLDTPNEIGTLARAFAKRTDQLQHFLADERLFTGDVSHELRTPLTIVLGAAELLKVQLAESPEQLAVAERIRRVAAEAAERVGALLLLSQSPETLGGSQLSLTHLIEREIERCQQLLGDKPVQIVFEDAGDVWVYARTELAGVAIGNLLRNACQYTEQGTVKIVLTPQQLTIEDNGPGIPENVRERLFERFVRGKENPYVGSGLGLAIVKRVADHLAWKIEHEAPENGGSRFILTFPAN
ncbi:signal transduction histidine kinase [Herminiimonas fonticola]|uniref:histidine kinase n=2 Tax=Herminiimonas fonticola TaxID=303380 RepID=A0A4V3BW44_9BURK|nr:Signal transduction histidine kinase [Herminiimonas fonticola]TDN93638.1 signal transduction histidine kinase [Herminiimonas fonticola]